KRSIALSSSGALRYFYLVQVGAACAARREPAMNVLIATLAAAVAAAFVSMPLVRHRYGATAMVCAQNELARQGVRTTALRENGMRFDASGHESAAPIGIAAVLLTVAGL